MIFTDSNIENLICPNIPILDINPLTKEIEVLTEVTIFMFYSCLKEAFLNGTDQALLAAYEFPMRTVGGDQITHNMTTAIYFILNDDWVITNPNMILPSEFFSLYQVRERNINELLN